MLIPKIYPLKQPSNLDNSIKITRRPILKKIIKIKKESTKDSLDNKEKKNPKTYQIKRIKVLYRPLNPQNKFNSLMTVEEIRLEQIREKTKQIRQERIRALMEKEAELKKEIFSKAMEYMNQFYTERKKKIEENHQKLLQKEQERNMGNNSGNLWQNISSDMTGSSSSADRMREAIMNKSKQEQNK